MPLIAKHDDDEQQASETLVVHCKVCKKPMVIFDTMGQGQEKKTVWFCQNKICTQHKKFVF
jgi:hypothetical protein